MPHHQQLHPRADRNAADSITRNAMDLTDEHQADHSRPTADTASKSLRVSMRCHCGSVDIPNIPVSLPLKLHDEEEKDDDRVGHDRSASSTCTAGDSLLVCYCERCRRNAAAAFGAYIRVAPVDAGTGTDKGKGSCAPAFFAQHLRQQKGGGCIIAEHDDTCSHLGPVTRYRCGKCHSSLGLQQHRSARDGCNVNDTTTRSSACIATTPEEDDMEATTWLAMGAVRDESVSKPIIDAWHYTWDDSDKNDSNEIDDSNDGEHHHQNLLTVACRSEKAAWVDARPKRSITAAMAAHMQPASVQQQQPRRCVKGGCSCGAVRYEIDSIAPHEEFQHCHCNLCRRMSGSAYMTWVPVTAQKFRWTRTDGLILMRTTHHGQRHACKKCGSVLTIVYDSQPNLVWPAAGAFDDHDLGSTEDVSEQTIRAIHICCAWKSPWYQLPDDSLPRIQYAA